MPLASRLHHVKRHHLQASAKGTSYVNLFGKSCLNVGALKCGCNDGHANFIIILRLLHDKITATALFSGTETSETEPVVITIQKVVKQGCGITRSPFAKKKMAPSYYY